MSSLVRAGTWLRTSSPPSSTQGTGCAPLPSSRSIRPFPASPAWTLNGYRPTCAIERRSTPAFAGAEVVHHLAAVISVRMLPDRRIKAVNVGGVANVIDACRRGGVRRLVHVSSIHALTTGRQHPAVRPVQGCGREARRHRHARGSGRRHRSPHGHHRATRLRSVAHGTGVPRPGAPTAPRPRGRRVQLGGRPRCRERDRRRRRSRPSG